MKPEPSQIAIVEGSPLPGNTFQLNELHRLLVNRLGAILPGWHDGSGCPGQLMSENGKWLSGKFHIQIEFIPDSEIQEIASDRKIKE